jgi:hypothetical protein
MPSTADSFGQLQFRPASQNFWERILRDEQLRDCNNLEKLLAGCEIIAALDDVQLLTAQMPGKSSAAAALPACGPTFLPARRPATAEIAAR